MSRRCSWCGRQATDYLLHGLVTDHGPAALVWCRDWRTCWAARKRPNTRTWT